MNRPARKDEIGSPFETQCVGGGCYETIPPGFIHECDRLKLYSLAAYGLVGCIAAVFVGVWVYVLVAVT